MGWRGSRPCDPGGRGTGSAEPLVRRSTRFYCEARLIDLGWDGLNKVHAIDWLGLRPESIDPAGPVPNWFIALRNPPDIRLKNWTNYQIKSPHFFFLLEI